MLMTHISIIFVIKKRTHVRNIIWIVFFNLFSIRRPSDMPPFPPWCAVPTPQPCFPADMDLFMVAFAFFAAISAISTFLSQFLSVASISYMSFFCLT